jgi:hypothetical protein
MRTYLIASVVLVGVAFSGVAGAQPQLPPTPPVPPTPPAPLTNSPPEVIAPKANTADKLGAGVIPPPNVDPGMSIKPPADGAQAVPVVPPSGAPGSNPQVKPQ